MNGLLGGGATLPGKLDVDDGLVNTLLSGELLGVETAAAFVGGEAVPTGAIAGVLCLVAVVDMVDSCLVG